MTDQSISPDTATPYDRLLKRLDEGADYQGYPEGFGGGWTTLCAEAARTIRNLTRASQPATPTGGEKAARDYEHGYNDGVEWAMTHGAARSSAGSDEAATPSDPTASAEWNNGCDFAMEQLCKFLDVDTTQVSWDAATETVDGDVQAVIGNILRAKFGEDWGPDDVAQPSSDAFIQGIREALIEKCVMVVDSHRGMEFRSLADTIVREIRAFTLPSTERASSVMGAAEKAAEVVDGWSDAKKDYAARTIPSPERQP